MKFCEICGALGAEKKILYAKDRKFEAYLCPNCENEHEDYVFTKRTKKKVIEEARKTMLVNNGPKSDVLFRIVVPREQICLCDQCFRPYGIDDDLHRFGDFIEKPKDLKFSGRSTSNIALCDLCITEYLKKFVLNIPYEELVLYLSSDFFKHKSFIEHREVLLNSIMKDLLMRRLSGEDISQYPSINPGEGLLVVSIDYISIDDYKLTKVEVVWEEYEEEYNLTILNPLLVAHDDHGLFIHVTDDLMEDEDTLFDFNYSYNFRQVLLIVRKSGYNYVRFDTSGPKYKELEELFKE